MQLCQSVLDPTTVTNKVGFRLLGLLAGYVGLRGRFEQVGDEADTVKVCDCPLLVRVDALCCITSADVRLRSQ